MIVFLLLVIIAILLFGASRVIGAVGALLGFIVLAVAVSLGVSIAAQIPVWVWWVFGAAGLGLVVWMVCESNKQAELQREYQKAKQAADEAQRRYEALTRGDKLPGYMGAPSTAKFYNNGGNKRSRKRSARRPD